VGHKALTDRAHTNNNMESFFGALAVLLALAQCVPYIYDILRGRTKPQRAAWLIWFALGGVLVFSQMAKGGHASVWVSLMHMAANLTVFLLALKYGYGRFTKLDWGSLALAGFGMVLWWYTKEPATALLIAILVDSIGVALVVKKAYREPHSETLVSWVLGVGVGLSATLAVGSFNPILLAYPVYVMANSALTAGTIIVRRRMLEPVLPPAEELRLEGEPV